MPALSPEPEADAADAGTKRRARTNPYATKRARAQVLLACVGALGVFAGVHFTQKHPAGVAPPLSVQALAGTWELQSVGGESIGPDVESGVLSQQIVFTDGKIQGETHLLATTSAATTAMPFPGESVARVETGADGHDVNVTWQGTYSLLSNNRLELHIGGAQYRLTATLDPKTHCLEFDHDAILTYKGSSRYRFVSH